MLFKGDLDNLADISYLNANLNTSKSCQDGLIRYLCSLYEYSERKTRNLFLGIDDEFTTVSLFNFKDYSLDLILNNFNVPLKCFKRLNNEFKSLIVSLSDDSYSQMIDTYRNTHFINPMNAISSMDSNTIIVKKYLELFEYFLSNNVKFKFSESINNELEFYHLLYSLKC